jgi:hypothetical protein
VENLFMAGRNISVTHVALGTVRVMGTGGMMGEVVGMAASLAKQHATTPRGVYEKHLTELQDLMRRGVGTKGDSNCLRGKDDRETGKPSQETFPPCRVSTCEKNTTD